MHRSACVSSTDWAATMFNINVQEVGYPMFGEAEQIRLVDRLVCPVK